ncbi:MAG: DegT/DnrJ/EryC1/StrS aminotransferase family protein [Acidobacteriota bacterium]
MTESRHFSVPYFRPELSDAEIGEVVSALKSGWLTSGPRVKRFEGQFAKAVGAGHAIALNSCTAALHLAVEALGLRVGEGVLVPTMTFAATAEIVRYLGGLPILVDCDRDTGNMDLVDAARKLEAFREGRLPEAFRSATQVVGIIPVHVGGLMVDPSRVREFAEREGLWVVEDAAHAFPASWRPDASTPWQRCGENTADVSCFSFYANKTITTGEGGMAVTNDPALADRMRLMSLHGLSRDAWERYSGGGWDYRIVAPGFKYNLTDLAAGIGIHQLERAEEMRVRREEIASRYREAFSRVEEIELPADDPNRVHAWHLFPIRIREAALSIDRNDFIDALKKEGIGCSVHWRPLHLHPYYEETFGWTPDDLPVASAEWRRLVSLPLFPAMREEEIAAVIQVVASLCARHSRRGSHLPTPAAAAAPEAAFAGESS